MTTLEKSAYQHVESLDSESSSGRAALNHLVPLQGSRPTKTPSRPPWTLAFESPFAGESPEEITKAIRERFRETLLDTMFCAVLDKRSKEERCAILMQTHDFPAVDGQDEEPGYITVRVPFQKVAVSLGCYGLGEGDIYDDLAEYPLQWDTRTSRMDDTIGVRAHCDAMMRRRCREVPLRQLAEYDRSRGPNIYIFAVADQTSTSPSHLTKILLSTRPYRNSHRSS